MMYTNSPLVGYTRLSPHHSGTRLEFIIIACLAARLAGDWDKIEEDEEYACKCSPIR